MAEETTTSESSTETEEEEVTPEWIPVDELVWYELPVFAADISEENPILIKQFVEAGAQYHVRVIAVNVFGEGEASDDLEVVAETVESVVEEPVAEETVEVSEESTDAGETTNDSNAVEESAADEQTTSEETTTSTEEAEATDA